MDEVISTSNDMPELDRTSRIFSPSSDNHGQQNANRIIVEFLLARVEVFRRLSDLRRKGWENQAGDAYFTRQRRTADTCSPTTASYFYTLMQRIAQEMHASTGCFEVPKAESIHPSILDLCMAPGGFLLTAVKQNPESRAVAFTLPSACGGHDVLLPKLPNVAVKSLDITMLAADMGVSDIPARHPDEREFLPQEFDVGQLFDLVLCDGQVLRKHLRAAYREKREARRLIVTQLSLGLEHIKLGGTMIVLLHKLEAWDTVKLLYQFSRFSSVRLYKPTAGHGTRSSFYMIATNVQSTHSEALLAIQGWKLIWKTATFGGEEEYERLIYGVDSDADTVLREFGTELVSLGREVWEVQARALAQAPFIRNV